MSQIFHSYDFLLALKAGEVHVLKKRSLDDLPFAQQPIYKHAYSAIKRLNYNQKGKFEAVLRTSRDGLKLGVICVFDGEDRAEAPAEYKRTYRKRKKAAQHIAAPSDGASRPLSYYMQAHHEGKKVEVFDGKAWRLVTPADWTTISNDNFRTTPIRVAVAWNADEDQRMYDYDVGPARIEQLKKNWKHVKVFAEE